MNYPCKNCEKEEWEGCCDNKRCPQWQQWFQLRWAYMLGIWHGQI